MEIVVSNRESAPSLHRNDGRAVSNLARAREPIIDWRRTVPAIPHWANAGELLAPAPPVGDAVDASSRAPGAEAI